ncbi:hypothetical protein [Frankia sp. EI5c]|uniref:hypothetical protein n=1 Tax=Frankia sp. EI5c TaxID=683316 RepID=UPI001F5BF1BF|nr:hypothetical protein [Frankia sp. EI5c]
MSRTISSCRVPADGCGWGGTTGGGVTGAEVTRGGVGLDDRVGAGATVGTEVTVGTGTGALVDGT